jgi:mitogen-activated protein kinase kinase kinase
MFHIGVATQHPPLPEPGQLSEPGINFIKQCLTINPVKRPTAVELMEHPWMLEFREALLRYEEAEIATSPPTEDDSYASATVARRAAMLKRKQAESEVVLSPSTSALETPTSEVEATAV